MRDLLDVLDAIVRADRAPTTLRGDVAIVVRTPSAERTWHASFSDRSTTTAFADRVPPNVTALLVLGENEASSLARAGRLPESIALCAGAGDGALMNAFIDRYFGAKSWLDVRAGARKNEGR